MNGFFKKLGIFIENKRLLVIIVSLALLIPFIFGASRIETRTGNDTFVSTDKQVYKDITRFEQNFSGDVVVLLLKADDLQTLIQPGNLSVMEKIENEWNVSENVVSAIGPAFFIKQAFLQQSIPVNSISEITDDPLMSEMLQVLIVDPETGEIRTEVISVFPDKQHAVMAVTLEGGLPQETVNALVDKVKLDTADAGFTGLEITVTGGPVINKAVLESMSSNMFSMLILSIIIMLLILVLIFSVRGFFAWRWLPLGVVLIALIYGFGIMGLISIPITMATMTTFPILIGLGVDYAIQFHNRYDEEARRGESVSDAIIHAATHIGPTIGIAIVAACLGFVALFFSPVPMIRDFGMTLILGVAASYVLSMFLLLAILYTHDRRKSLSGKEKNGKAKEGRQHIVDKGLLRLAPWVIKNPVLILPIALILCVGGFVVDHKIDTETNIISYLSPGMQEVKDVQEAESIIGGISSANFLVEADDITDPAILDWMVQTEQSILAQQPNVFSSSSIADLILMVTGGVMPPDSETVKGILASLPDQITRNYITADHMTANISFTVPQLTSEEKKELRNSLEEYALAHPDGMSVTVTGSTIFSIELIDALTGGRNKMTIIGIALVFAGLFFLFKFNILRALIAILPIGLILGWSSGMMYLLDIKYNPITATLGALVIGIGVEFTILLMMRYYEEREKGFAPEVAMTTAVTRIGRAITASGLTVIGGFAALLIARDFPIIQNFGKVTLINVFFALVSTLFVLATLLVTIDRWRERSKKKKAVEPMTNKDIK